MDNKNKFTKATGEPVNNDLTSKTAGEFGPVLIEDSHLIEKLAHFNRERIPERIVHAKGAGAFGEFICDPEPGFDITKYTRAKFLSAKDKKTELFLRFSTVGGEKGSADSERDPRGFAIKFYTEEGNYDLVGNNTPVFFIRDAIKFPDFIHTQKRNPVTNLKDANMFWDFLSLTPESLHQVSILFSSRGTPASYRNMNGYGSHTFMWYTDENNYHWVKYHLISDQGVKNLTADQAGQLKSSDADFHTMDLYDAIENKKFPSRTVYVQIMDPKEVNNHDYNPFDVTKVWPHKDYPMHKIGEMTLTKNPTNYFADVEQAAFSPSNFVPGIDASPDKMLQGRLFAYPDSQRYRIGPNFDLLPINAPKFSFNYQVDGAMRFDNVAKIKGINYWPNSFSDVKPDITISIPKLKLDGKAGKHNINLVDYDFVQPRSLYQDVMDDQEKQAFVENIYGALKNAIIRIQKRQTTLFYKMDNNLGSNLAKMLKLDVNEIKDLSKLSQAELVNKTKI